jgi:hypothetical protein
MRIKTGKTTRQVTVITMRLGSPIDFEFDRPPYDAMCQDHIASTSFPDVCREIEIFRNAGYPEQAIEDIYTELRESARRDNYGRGRVKLQWPVKLTINVDRWR